MFSASRWLGTEQYVEKYLTVPQGALFLVLFSGFYSPSLFFVCLLLIFVFLNFVFLKKKLGGTYYWKQS